MGLAVSQVRLLALTRRKADIELDIQIDSKRKQAITRKSTELAQTYYQKLQQSKIQYATSDGYENVNYDYLMGKSNGDGYDAAFLKQILLGNGDIAQKSCNSMILTNQYGKVVLNDELSALVKKTQMAFGDQAGEVQTAEALLSFIESHKDTSSGGFVDGYVELNNLLQTLGHDTSMKIVLKMLENGGYMEGGTIYECAVSGSYVKSADKAKMAARDLTPDDFVTPQDGYNYKILTPTGGPADSNTYTCMWLNGGPLKGATSAMMKYLSNLLTYLTPMLSAALKNGSTSTVEFAGVKDTRSGATNPTLTDHGTFKIDDDPYKGRSLEEIAKTGWTDDTGTKHDPVLKGNDGYVILEDKNGKQTIWKNLREYRVLQPGDDGYDPTNLNKEGWVDNISQVTNISDILVNVKEHNTYAKAKDTNTLQNGFRSGVYQLCMVDDVEKGRYHKNTTLDYFIQMGYVSEKLDSSIREEITAWYNSEQAKISEQETYWDEEITNLSTELSSVNTEIDSVKTLKSNAIKSVFDWGSN